MSARFGMAWLDRGFRPQQASHQIERRPSGMCDIERNVDILINTKLKGCMVFPLQAGSASTKIVEPGGSECAGDEQRSSCVATRRNAHQWKAEL
jgi:hypothetical protein